MAGHLNQTVRRTGTSGLDFFPTQPWPTRALLERIDIRDKHVWEPACGGGHMAEVLWEGEPDRVLHSDIKDYGYDGTWVFDFVDHELTPDCCDWVITNPPFKKKLIIQFAKAGIRAAREGVALLGRLSWLEGAQRYDALWSDDPPTNVYVLCDRLGFVEGDCKVGRVGMLPYAWYVWDKGARNSGSGTTELSWVPPGSSKRLTLPGDVEKFNRRVIE